ncbi:hypothetical protein BJX64DRAFT_292609 [Aspergillus heterothallicus]
MSKPREGQTENAPTSTEGRQSSSTGSRDKPPVGKRIGHPQKVEEQAVAHVKEATVQLATAPQEAHFQNQAQTQISALEQELKQATAYIRNIEAQAKKERDQANKFIRSLRGQLAAAEERNRQLEGIVVSTQESALNAIVADKGNTPLEDQVVRDRLAQLGEKIRIFARKHSWARVEDCDGLIESNKDFIIKGLHGYTSEQTWEGFVNTLPFSSAKIPVLLVQALLAKSIFEGLFAHPFFMFGKTESKNRLPDPDEMMEIYRIMLQIDKREGHLWRSQTLRGLCRSAGNEQPSFLQERIGKMSGKLANDFLFGLAGGLLRHNNRADGEGATRSIERDLQELYNSAAQLALLLWMQRSFIVCESQGAVPVFDVTNPVLRAHRLHQLDEDDRKLDGKKILLFVQPAILAFGSENAEHYDKCKVWAPAVVVVGQ